MRFSPPNAKKRHGFDMTPMIDVVLQLIIFFMYTSQFAQMARTPVDLPEEKGDETKITAPSTVTIDIDATGLLRIEGNAVEISELVSVVEAEIRNAGGDPALVTVLLRADRKVESLHINRVAGRLTGLGLRGWKLATESPGGAG
ncbi:MAG: ExbD/TolR family protein [Phycisphaerales bacterium JB037]